MNLRKKIVFGLCSGLVIIQFIQPDHNKSNVVLNTDIEKLYTIPHNVSVILKKSCYDCHSNNTRYPWYSKIQPGAWLMASHIRKGKANLNFSGFGSYSNRRQQNKLEAIANSINDKTMPLWSYTILHKNVKLSASEETLLLDWIKTIKDGISSKNN